MKFSFIFPTRGRLDKLRRTLASIEDTVADIRNVQVLIAVDKDEKELYDICSQPPLEVLVGERQDSLASYQNKLLPLVKGDAVWVWGDDNIIITPKWDKIIEKAVVKSGWRAFGDDIWYVNPTVFSTDKSNRVTISLNPLTKEPFCCFPIISKKACDALGYIITPKYRHWGADLYMNSLFQNVGRVIPMEEVVVYTEESIANDEKMAIYKEDLRRLVEANKAVYSYGTAEHPEAVKHFVEDEVQKLRDAMILPRFYE